MSNRHQRRVDVREFRRDVHHDHVVTYLIAADQPLDDNRLLRDALSFWRSNIQRRRPFCPNCRANFADDAHPGAFLFRRQRSRRRRPASRRSASSAGAICRPTTSNALRRGFCRR